MPQRPRILFVAMQHSVHVARWIDMVADLDFELHMFALDPAPPHDKLRNITLHVPVAANPLPRSPAPRRRERAINVFRSLLSDPVGLVRRIHARRRAETTVASSLKSAGSSAVITVHMIVPSPGTDVRLGRPGESDQTASWPHVPSTLAALIRDLQPDLIHSMEFQHAAYLVLAARDLFRGKFPRWLATNWGSDIFYFGRLQGHDHQIRRLCRSIDLYSCECHRDVGLAREFGYTGPALPVLPNSGGMDVEHVQSLRDPRPPSQRKTIMVKGYDHFAGRAMVSLSVLERFAEQLAGYRVILFSVGARPRVRALELAAAGVLDIKVIDLATHDEILSYFGQSRLYLGISMSDAISTSVLESMAMGAFPIQTNTSCCEEWFVSGETGFAVAPDDYDTICARFLQALTDDHLVDYAAQTNLTIVRSRLDVSVIRPQVKDFYRQALAGGSSQAAGFETTS
jgi:hypothetical protein